MDDLELLRYSRHILLDDIGIEGQERISGSHVLIIGAGGLGSACAPYLAAAGVGTMSIMDHDHVELTNLQRQIMHQSNAIGLAKVVSAKSMLEQLNPHVKVIPLQEKADSVSLQKAMSTVDVVVDCTDNFKTRHLINSMCVQLKIPLVSGAAIEFDGQVSVFNPQDDQSACYACVFPEEDSFEEVSCATMGVFSPLVAIIGSLQAAQVLQLITQCGEPLVNKLLMWNARQSTMMQIKLAKAPTCKVCGPKF
ncbi:MAG: HesA/MoeB/ThiF family protein [Betaproteobacteria bacterium]|jgi:molybdopterin/thiamine biosynthesis adenylyltransferase